MNKLHLIQQRFIIILQFLVRNHSQAQELKDKVVVHDHGGDVPQSKEANQNYFVNVHQH
jgi:hypothetical protein